MNATHFIRQWLAVLPEGQRAAFVVELAVLCAAEQARERRKLCIDQEYYRRSVDETMAELRETASEMSL